MCKKACYTCKFGQYNPEVPASFYDPGEPAYTECMQDAISMEQWEKHLEDFEEEERAEKCGFYQQAEPQELWKRFGDEITFEAFCQKYGLTKE